MPPFVIAFQSDFCVWIDLRRRPRVVVDGVGASQPFELCGVCRRHGKRLDVAPFRTEEVGGNVGAFIAGLIDELGQLQGLPAVGEEHVGVARFVHHQVPIHRVVVGVLVIDDFERTVLEPIRDVLFSEVIAERCSALHPRSVRVIGLVPGRVVAQGFHLGVDVRGDSLGTWRIGKPVLQQPVHPVADAQLPRRQSVFRLNLGHPFISARVASLLVAQKPRLRADNGVLTPCRPRIVHQS